MSVPSRLQARMPLLIFPCNGNGIEAVDCIGEAYRLIGFVDDTREKQESRTHGYPVLSRAALSEFADCDVLAVPGGPASFMERRRIIESLGIGFERFARVIH